MLRRLTQSNPPNRWEAARVEYDLGEAPQQSLQVYVDDTASILAENQSPDIPFRFSLNPYRGCGVAVNVAPLIPGLSDRDLIPIMQAARDAGAMAASAILLRLPGSTATVFGDRLQQALPTRAGKVLGLTREMRGGRLNDPRFHSRMSGEGRYAATLLAMFESTANRLGYRELPPRRDTFRRPKSVEQLTLFEDAVDNST